MSPVPALRSGVVRVPVGHALVIAVVMALIWAGIGFDVWQEYRSARVQAVGHTDTLSRALAESINAPEIAVADRSGVLLASNLGPVSSGLSLADRVYFRVQAG